MSEQRLNTGSHDLPVSDALVAFMKTGWADSELTDVQHRPVASFAALRRAALSAKFPGFRIVLPAGSFKVRANDTDYKFRAHSTFSYYSGLGATDVVPDSVLVLEPTETGHTAVLYIHPRSPKNTEEFFRDRRHGEFWVGRRHTENEMRALYGLDVAHVHDVYDAISDATPTLAVRGEDAAVDAALPPVHDREHEFIAYTSEARLIKDDFEIDELRKACDSTMRGFNDMVRAFPAAVKEPNGERVIEAAFYGRARLEGNEPGYDSIVAAGAHACVLHWIKNDGPVRNGDLILIDAGVETDAHYTADVTRTLPVNGRFTDAQRRIYMLVYEAQEAAFAVIKPGVNYREIYWAAQRVLARGLEQLGFLGITAEESLKPDVGLHRRWTVHATGHMLGIDVHDCAKARSSEYLDGPLQAGMVLTVEPGLYFNEDDLLIPEEFRGIGVRIEDDLLVTESGFENLTAGLPRHPDDIERWMQQLL